MGIMLVSKKSEQNKALTATLFVTHSCLATFWICLTAEAVCCDASYAQAV